MNLDRSSTDWVPIELDREPLLKTLKILISRNMALINQKTDSIDRALIEPGGTKLKNLGLKIYGIFD